MNNNHSNTTTNSSINSQQAAMMASSSSSSTTTTTLPLPLPLPLPTTTTTTTTTTAATATTGTGSGTPKPKKDNSRRLDKNEKNVLLHLLQAPKLTNNDIARIIDVDERTVSRRRKQLRTIGHLSPERNSKGAEKLRPWHLEKVLALLEENNDLQLKDCQEFLQREFDLHVTLSTISRQLKRANHARATRPGYKATRPDLQEEEGGGGEQQDRQQQLPGGEIQTTTATPPPLPPQLLTPFGQARQLAQNGARGIVPSRQQQQGQGQAQDQHATGPAALKLACPFYKHNPQRYANGPYCHGQWPTARDVKEHIYRQHMVPKFRCNRCMANFPDVEGLIAHQRALQPCDWREWEPLDGCTEEQKTKIRKGDKGDEVHRWNRTFRILFPDVDDNAVPSALAEEEGPYFAVAVDPELGRWGEEAVPDDVVDESME